MPATGNRRSTGTMLPSGLQLHDQFLQHKILCHRHIPLPRRGNAAMCSCQSHTIGSACLCQFPCNGSVSQKPQKHSTFQDATPIRLGTGRSPASWDLVLGLRVMDRRYLLPTALHHNHSHRVKVTPTLTVTLRAKATTAQLQLLS